jgi:hypothetical protein
MAYLDPRLNIARTTTRVGGTDMTMQFLPALDQSMQPPAPSGGAEWSGHQSGLGVLGQYSTALDVPTLDVPPERVKSVPSPWARLLLSEHALFSKRHPLHSAVQEEWRGLLGVVALADYLAVPFRVQAVDLEHGSGIVASLLTMVPESERPAWGQLGLLYIGSDLIGGTSPRTLAFTGIRSISNGAVPFQKRGRFIDPTKHFSAQGDRNSLALLAEWLEVTRRDLNEGQTEVGNFLGKSTAGTAASALPRIVSLLKLFDEWSAETTKALENIGRPSYPVSIGFSESKVREVFAYESPGYAAFSRLRHIIPAVFPTTNGLRTESGTAIVLPGETGLLMRGSQPFTGTVELPHGMGRPVTNGRFQLPTSGSDIQATWPDLGRLFEDKLLPISGADPVLVRALLIQGNNYFYPFKKEILDYLDTEQLFQWVKVDGDVATGATVSLEIPLVNGLRLVHRHRYSTANTFPSNSVPALDVTVWPDFDSPTWNHYFYNVRHRLRGVDQLELEPLPKCPTFEIKDSAKGLSWGHRSTSPKSWSGRYRDNEGLLLCVPLSQSPALSAEWDISIDFGSTHTRVFRSSFNSAGGLQADEVSLQKRARSLFGTDPSLQFNFFVALESVSGSDVEAPSLAWLPLEVVLTHPTRDWLPSDGVMYWGAVQDAPSTRGLRGNLKWHRDNNQEREVFHSYVSQLYLASAAEAAAVGARIRSLITAYPSVLPAHLRHRHKQEWRLLGKYGIEVKDAHSESQALAAFLINEGGATIAANLIAVDIGGSTSDITIWRGNQWAEGDSIRLAGDILGRLVDSNEGARNAISAALSQPPFNRAPIQWAQDDSSKNELILNSIFRWISQNAQLAREKDTLARILCVPNSDGERVVAHVGYLFATISFLLGMMVRKNNLIADRFDVRFAGKGSEFIHWLNALSEGASSTLPASFFRAGHGALEDTCRVECVPPGWMAKQEVGRGLLAPMVPPGKPSDNRITFLGETGFVGVDGPLDWSAPLTFELLAQLKLPAEPTGISELKNLTRFVDTFSTHPAGQRIALSLGIKKSLMDASLRDQIHTRIFDANGAWGVAQSASDQGDKLLEPFFVTEAKVLLEQATKNRSMFFK